MPFWRTYGCDNDRCSAYPKETCINWETGHAERRCGEDEWKTIQAAGGCKLMWVAQYFHRTYIGHWTKIQQVMYWMSPNFSGMLSPLYTPYTPPSENTLKSNNAFSFLMSDAECFSIWRIFYPIQLQIATCLVRRHSSKVYWSLFVLCCFVSNLLILLRNYLDYYYINHNFFICHWRRSYLEVWVAYCEETANCVECFSGIKTAGNSGSCCGAVSGMEEFICGGYCFLFQSLFHEAYSL